MKPPLSFLLALALLSVVSTTARASPAKTAPSSPATSSSGNPQYKLPETGKNVPCETGGWLNAEASGTRLVIKFFDAERKPIPPDVVRGFVRFRSPAKKDAHAPLYLEGKTLVTPATERPPHNFWISLTLAGDGSEAPAESVAFKYP